LPEYGKLFIFEGAKKYKFKIRNFLYTEITKFKESFIIDYERIKY